MSDRLYPIGIQNFEKLSERRVSLRGQNKVNLSACENRAVLFLESSASFREKFAHFNT